MNEQTEESAGTETAVDDQAGDDDPEGGDGGGTEEPASDRGRDRLYIVGLLSGIGAFLGGYLSTLVLALGFGNVDLSGGVVGPLRAVGLFFYNSFNVPDYSRRIYETTVKGSLNGGQNKTWVLTETRQAWQNSITGWQKIQGEVTANGTFVREYSNTSTAATNLSLPPEIYLLVPVVLLLAFGFVLGYWALRPTETSGASHRQTLLAGGVLTLGFLLSALIGTFVFAESIERALLRPARFETLLYGFAYPAIAGTTGIAVGRAVQTAVGKGNGDPGHAVEDAEDSPGPDTDSEDNDELSDDDA